jgi:serine/threonine protein kinase/Tol biopolymer transport system component
MAITSGTKLGPYEVAGAIGAGGMGEVYRARDPRLNREVAIKVLPAALSDDQQYLHRLKQEALAVAALNHPNILAVYDIGTQDNGSPYIVSELLEGESLRERLRAGPMSLRKTIDYALQIARGLSAAHDKGIVHRDVKPENIFITHDGRLKLLDFGLAKLTKAAPSSGDAETHTIQSEAGTVLGTVGYMSPEQIRGKPGDARSDLFAFGAVLYEMISGKRAFHGETPADTMSAILHSEPLELTETNRNVPPALERIVRHCLEKNPEERFRSAHDLAFDLEMLSSVSTTTAATQLADKTSRRRVLGALLGLVVFTVAIGTFLALKYRGGTTHPPRFHRITYERGSVLSARFSADGNSVVYDAAWEGKRPHLFSTPASGPEPRALDLENAHLFGVSRTGEAALGLGGRVGSHLMVMGATLARSPLGGGSPREILHNVLTADWAPDGTMAVAHYEGGRMRLEYPIGKVLYETSGWVSDLRFSRAGDKIAFLDHPYWPDDRGWVAVTDLAGNWKRLSGEWEAEDGLAWSPAGSEIWFTATSAGIERALYAVTFSGKQREVLTVPGTLRLFDIHPDGRVLLAAGHERMGMTGTTADNKERDLSWSGWTIAEDISPDGKWVLFDEQSEFAGSTYTIAVRTIEGSPPVKLGEGAIARYSPDGKWVAGVTPGQFNHFTLLPTGAGQPREVPIAGLDKLQIVDFTPDGKLLLIGSVGGHGLRCYIRSMEDGPIRPITPEGNNMCRPSSDSRYIVASDSAGAITVYSVDGQEPRSIPATNGVFPIRWTDNQSVLAFGTGELPARVFLIDIASGRQRVIKTLAPGDRAGVSQLQTMAASPDGQSFAYSYQQVLYDLYVVEGLK